MLTELWGSEPLAKGFRGQNPLRKSLGSQEHLNWLKIEININMNIQGKSQADNI